MAKKHKKQLTAVEKMLIQKRELVARLSADIDAIRDNAGRDIEHVRSRIRIAQSLIAALEKGTLKL